MKTKIIFFIFCFIISLFFPKEIKAKIWINEVMPDPDGEDTGNEWIELYNDSGSEVILDTYVLEAKNGNTYQMPVVGKITNYLVIKADSLYGFKLVNSGTITVNLYPTGGVSNPPTDSFVYTGSSVGKSWGRIPDGGGVSSDKLNPTPGQPNSLPTSTPIPTATSGSTAAIYKINDAKDGDGSVLEQVKIFIDGQYTGNYTDETYTFCDGCKCGSNNIACGFGNHTFKTEKDGYDSWTETRNISIGGNYEVNPVMTKQDSSSPTITPTPTPTVKATPTKTPTPKASIKASSTPSASDESEKVDVLGLRQELVTLEPSASPEEVGAKKKVSPLSVVFLMSGGLVIGLAGFSSLKTWGKEYNERHEEKKPA